MKMRREDLALRFRNLIHNPLFWRICILIVSLLAFEEVADDVFDDPSEGDYEAVALDNAISKFFFGFRSNLLNHFMIDFTSLGSFSVLMTLCLIAGFFLLSLRHYRQFLQLLLAGGGVVVLVPMLKLFFNRERPEGIHHLTKVADLSFPSGHAFGSAAIYITLTYIALSSFPRPHEKIVSVLIGTILIVAVSVSRIYLGVHFPTDVMAGIAGGTAWACAVELGFRSKLLRSSS